MPMPAALARYHAQKAGSTQVVRRTSIKSSPTVKKLEGRVKAAGARARRLAAEAEVENPFISLAGAALPAVISKFSGKTLPTVGGMSPEILWGGGLMGLSFLVKGSTRRRLMTLGAGVAGPGVHAAIKAGTIRVSGDDDEISAGANNDDDI